MSTDINSYFTGSRLDIEMHEAWRYWAEAMPAIRFPPSWEIKMVPPYGGAMVRFCASKGSKRVSVYLDCHEKLGFFGGPYWEMYPIAGNTARVELSDVVGLFSIIETELSSDT